MYWKRKGLNQLADAENFTEITASDQRRTDGAEARLRFYERAKLVLASAFPASSAKRKTPVKTPDEPKDALLRGAEAVLREPPPPAFVAPPTKSLAVRPDTLDFAI